jgi:hypothetical protein
MRYDALITATAAALAPLASATQGRVEVAESLEEARALLDLAPGRWRIVLHWEGYAEHPEARHGMVTHQIATVIQAPRGLAHKPNPTTPGRAGPAFSTHIAAVMEWMTALRFPDGTGADTAGYAPAGSQWLASPRNLTTHVLSWKLDAALPPFSQTIPLSF